ncbi:hypothetical protein LCGC14_0695600 [marine sediment metagenome]|uniref:Uncharacterized protein n=1 Tax=marine sediment metagenome TaxID=412755 RepID=A0A0F9R4L4_9ZZZZ|nr:MAG: hypothetical protein Lokiarch_10440 [Candidatus Lokiarchaeum sp. GC14_75]
MFCQEQIESNNKNKIRLLFTVKRLTEAFLFFFGVLIITGFLLRFYEMPRLSIGLPTKKTTELAIQRWIFKRNLIQSMIFSGMIGIIISTPITIGLRIRLKKRQSVYIKQEYGHNKDFIKLQRNSLKTVESPKWS